MISDISNRFGLLSRKKKFTIFLLFLGALGMLSTTFYVIAKESFVGEDAQASSNLVYYVDKDNIGGTCSNTSNDGSITKPFCTLAKAVSVAVGGDTILMRAGTYPSVSIEKKYTYNYVTIKPYNNEKVVFNAAGSYAAIQIKRSELIRLEGLELTGAKGYYGAGLYMDLSNKIEVIAVKAYGNDGSATGGFLIENTGNILLKDNETYNNGISGIKFIQKPTVIASVSGIKIIGNKSYNNIIGAGNADGIGLEGAGISGTIIKDNVAYNNGDDGIDTWTSHSNIVEGNVAYGHKNAGDGNGFKVGGTGGALNGGNNIIRFNISYDNKLNGFTSNGGGNNRYYNNVSYANGKYGFDDGWRYEGCTASTCKTYFINNIGVNNTLANIVANQETYESHNNLWFDSATNSAKISYNYSVKSTLADFYKASGNRLENPTTSLVADPMFNDVSKYDFRLKSGSPAIDFGDITPDLGLTYRGSAPDLGIAEYYPAIDGSTSTGGSTTPTPTPAVCGNSIVESGESCDDGNTANGDQCSSTCANKCVTPEIWDGTKCYTETTTQPPVQPTDGTAPVVNITSPTTGTVLKIGSTLTVNANATDNIGVTKVEMYLNSKLICTDYSPSYSCKYRFGKKEVGAFTVTAKAYDSAGNVSTSVVTITVN